MQGRPPTLRLRVPASSGRAFTLGLTAALSLFLLVSAGPASAIFVFTDSVEFTWSPASGPVFRYGVFVSRNGEPREHYSDVYELTNPSVRITGEAGDSVIVYVRAYDAAGNYGDFSEPSEPILFARPGDSPPSEPPPSEPPPVAVRFDFDGDGRADILWSNLATGDAVLWRMDGSQRVGLDWVDAVPVEWQVAFSGDFDGDGRADLVWRDDAAGENDVWLMDGAAVLEDAALPAIPADWLPVGAGDFDGDGREDLLWEQQDTGDLELWLMNGIQRRAASGSIAGPGGDWYASCVADFDGDGRADIFYREVETGENQVWRMDGRDVIGVDAAGVSSDDWSVTGCGDYDGDGWTDILWRREKTESAGRRRPRMLSWGSGRVEMDEVALWLMDGHGQVASRLRGSAGPDWRVVASADYDGDGKLEILWRHDSSGENQLWLTNGRTVLQVSAIPVAEQPFWKLASRDWYDADRRSYGRPDEPLPSQPGGDSQPPATEDTQPPWTEQPAGRRGRVNPIWW